MTGQRHAPVLEYIGSAIVRGQLPSGRIETLGSLAASAGTARSIVEDAVQRLITTGMLRAMRTEVYQILPIAHWDVLDANVIRWRLDSPSRTAQLQELEALHSAIEPKAAELAAARRSELQAEELVEIARAMCGAIPDGSNESVLLADRRYHALILMSARDAMLARLSSVVETALGDKPTRWLGCRAPTEHDLRLHSSVAAAIRNGSPDEAAAGMVRIVSRNHSGYLDPFGRASGLRPRLIPAARKRRVTAVIAEHGYAGVAELSRTLGVTSMTIRRDLVELDASGALRRVRGGAVRRE